MLQLITDNVVDWLLGAKRKLRPSIRKRVEKLVFGGFYEMLSIKISRMGAKEDGTTCLLA